LLVHGMTSASDAELLAAVSRRDAQAFAHLLQRHHGPVYRVVWRMTGGVEAEDIVQETFFKLWQKPEQVREAAALRGWLMRVASNAAIDRSRKPRLAALDDAPDVADGRADAAEVLQRTTAARAVDTAIAALPERQRLALSLVYFEGLTNIEAASVMEASVEAIESLLSRARRTLKESLAGQWQELLGSLAGDGA
jgi:RNA polymerase sigma-70 factor, ECF subfamily